MAIRNLRLDEDPILRKQSRPITDITDRIKTLAEDMLETMYHAEGVGLAAPQVGVLRRIITVDVGEGPYVMINPEILEQEGEVIDSEGCLSFPDVTGYVKRPQKIKVKYTDLDGAVHTIDGENLMARCVCHEVDHLNGIVFVDKLCEPTEVNYES
ncbi:MAG: peptide deformylase [Eubacteriaceae bacterium]|nr:peptide deformylase [Eubacteriaceae bacterium]MBR0384326.1 peptide deformylase [Eubacteriaceae bacterium]